MRLTGNKRFPIHNKVTNGVFYINSDLWSSISNIKDGQYLWVNRLTTSDFLLRGIGYLI